ncbi:MAG: DUF4290 domain-containing protein [Cytophagaceae bacterium]|jgi:hypothetical protein|nr:DUF4290 domain-containing protein [Cytophagaceae bacterium]
MDYNSNRKKLVLPEYGRHIQKMVNHAVTVEDRTERRRCADAIVAVMGSLFPHLRDINDFKHKLWDHLAIMSDFKLDIDFPYSLPEAENFTTKPERIPYDDQKMHYRHYGILVERLLGEAVQMEDGAPKDRLISAAASHMRKSLMSWNNDFATDERLVQDIKELSDGKLIVTAAQVRQSGGRDTKSQTNRNTRQQNSRDTQNRKPHFVRKNTN